LKQRHTYGSSPKCGLRSGKWIPQCEQVQGSQERLLSLRMDRVLKNVVVMAVSLLLESSVQIHLFEGRNGRARIRLALNR
jgi:hypothetical protein